MTTWSEQEIVNILADKSEKLLYDLLHEADFCRQQSIGNYVYLRGLIEFANDCDRNCYYCGIRRGNHVVDRYVLSQDAIVELALTAYGSGYHSLALQSGESNDPSRVDFVKETVKVIKQLTVSKDPTGNGLGITLSIGELAREQYRQLREAGAHRYLLRIETSDKELFRKLHPRSQSFEKRVKCLEYLRAEGYQVGTGIMVGLPGQTLKSLARDLKFFVDLDIDMLGLGPYIPQGLTPLYKSRVRLEYDPFMVTLKMLALARLFMPDINMVASTALQTINDRGLELGLMAGANIVMPVLTPEAYRASYSLYEAKKYHDPRQLIDEISGYGYSVGLWTWGDSRHFKIMRQ